MIYFSVQHQLNRFSPAQEEHIVFKDPVLKNSQRHVRKGSSVQRSFGVKAKICYHHTRLRALVRSRISTGRTDFAMLWRANRLALPTCRHFSDTRLRRTRQAVEFGILRGCFG